MARPSYLSRREGGRYYLQVRMPEDAKELYGRPILRAFLRTSNFTEARRRLMDNIGWVRELIDAPDLEAIGTVIHGRLKTYTAVGPPQNERALAERTAFEHQVRHYMARANARGYDFSHRFEFFASKWVDFVDQNKAGEASLLEIGRQRAYERGRVDAIHAIVDSANDHTLVPSPFAASSAQPKASGTVALSHEVHQAIDQIVRNEIGKYAGQIAMPSAAAPAPVDTAVPPASPPVAAANPLDQLKLSEALARFLAPPRKKLKRKTKGHQDAAAIVQFAIDFLGDPPLNSITIADWDRLDEAMPEIPHVRNLPVDSRTSLHKRYRYAQEHGWDGITRVTQATVQNRYHIGINKFIAWSIREKLYLGERPKFECTDDENLVSLPRDAFEDDELIKLISLPLFTGCLSAHRIWKSGKYFVQNYLYWGYLILIMTGMRSGEVGQLSCDDILTDGENYFFDLRPFNARKGRVALKDLRNLKTNSSGRVVPIHPLLVDLGLLDRVFELRKRGEKRLFPEWEPYTRSDGTIRWSQPITKSWQYVKGILKLTRADLTLYGTRHLMADWLDTDAIAQRVRNRILGHVGDVPGRYGRKGMLDRKQVSAIESLEPPVVKRMREILMAAKLKADRGDLVIIKPYSPL
jgi:integrase